MKSCSLKKFDRPVSRVFEKQGGCFLGVGIISLRNLLLGNATLDNIYAVWHGEFHSLAVVHYSHSDGYVLNDWHTVLPSVPQGKR